MPTIAVVIPAYNAARWIGESLAAVFAQTDAAEQVLVVDDGSTDGTLEAIGPWRDRLTVIEQANAGCGGAFNTGIDAAWTDYVALCPADDLWDRRKIEFQRATLIAHPAVDVSFGAAVNFGLHSRPEPRPAGVGILDRDAFMREMFERNVIPDPTVVVRRDLIRRLGGFVAEIGEDYEMWMRALREGAVFHFDERVVVRLRQHGGNLSAQALAIRRMNLRVHEAAQEDIGDAGLVARVLASDQAAIGRCLAGVGRAAESREAFVRSLHHRVTPTALAGALALRVPGAELALAALCRHRGSAT